MASVTNRSNYCVSVKHRPDLTREFPFDALARAKAYAQSLKDQGFKPALAQGEDRILVRIRAKGRPAQTTTVGSFQEAEDTIARIEGERRNGLFRDYTRAHRVTFAQLMRDYLEDRHNRKHKGAHTERVILEGFIADSSNKLTAAIKENERREKAGEEPLPIKARRIPRVDVEWVQLPFADIAGGQIEAYADARMAQGLKPAIVDRELDLLGQVVHWAIDKKSFISNATR